MAYPSAFDFFKLHTHRPPKNRNPPYKSSYRQFCISGGHLNALARERSASQRSATTVDGVFRLISGSFRLDSPPTYAFWLRSPLDDEPEARKVLLLELMAWMLERERMVVLYARLLEREQILKREVWALARERMLKRQRESHTARSEISLLETQLAEGLLSFDDSELAEGTLSSVDTAVVQVDDEARRVIETLQNNLLMVREEFEDLVEELSDVGPHVDVDDAVRIKKLKDKIAALENREETYKSVFAAKLSVFRKGCLVLFGYKVAIQDHVRSDGIHVMRFTLQSVHMREDENLQFEWDSERMYIVENDYTSRPEISEQIERNIVKFKSIYSSLHGTSDKELFREDSRLKSESIIVKRHFHVCHLHKISFTKPTVYSLGKYYSNSHFHILT